MKNKFVVIAMVLSLLVAVIPFAAFAGAPMMIKIDVRNTTGADANLDFVDAAGNHVYNTVVEGVSELSKLEGVYTYYAQTVCGNKSGVINVSMQKTLFLGCDEGAAFVKYDKCENGNMYRGLFNPGGRINLFSFGVGPAAFIGPDHGCYYGITPSEYGHGVHLNIP